MKFSYILSVLLATLAIASPIPNPESTDVAELDVRASDAGKGGKGGKGHGGHGGHGSNPAPKVEETAEYKAAKAAMPFYDSFEKDHFYYFTVEWKRSRPADSETTKEIEEVRDELGFNHIGLVVGQVKETTTGKGKNLKTKKDFIATMYDMQKKNANPSTTEPIIRNWKTSSLKLEHQGKTTAAKAKDVTKHAKAYTKTTDFYKARGNNCNDFVQALMKTL